MSWLARINASLEIIKGLSDEEFSRRFMSDDKSDECVSCEDLNDLMLSPLVIDATLPSLNNETIYKSKYDIQHLLESIYSRIINKVVVEDYGLIVTHSEHIRSDSHNVLSSKPKFEFEESVTDSFYNISCAGFEGKTSPSEMLTLAA